MPDDHSRDPWWLLEQLWGQLSQLRVRGESAQDHVEMELRENIEAVLRGD